MHPASWPDRAAAAIIDALLGIAATLPAVGGYAWFFASQEPVHDADGFSADTGAVLVVLVGVPVAAGFWIWNLCLRQGRTGRSLGKSAAGIRLVDAVSGRPVGAGRSLLRQLFHYLDLLCVVGYLWPLWDPQRRTFADMLADTAVVREDA